MPRSLRVWRFGLVRGLREEGRAWLLRSRAAGSDRPQAAYFRDRARRCYVRAALAVLEDAHSFGGLAGWCSHE